MRTLLEMRIEELEEQNAALVAQVEALREAWKAVKRNDWDAPLDESFEKTPQHHLCQVRADAVMDAIKIGFTPEQFHALKDSRDGVQLRADAVSKFAEHVFTGTDCLHVNLKAYANQYTDNILAGKE